MKWRDCCYVHKFQLCGVWAESHDKFPKSHDISISGQNRNLAFIGWEGAKKPEYFWKLNFSALGLDKDLGFSRGPEAHSTPLQRG